MREFLDSVFSVVCGQNPDHTWAPGGILLPCCQRCVGLYVGAVVAVVLQGWLRPRLTPRFLWLHGAFLIVMAPLGFHWVPQGPVLRAISGILFGFGVVAFLILARRMPPQCAGNDQKSCGMAGYWGVLVATLILVPLLAEHGGRDTGWLLSGIAFCGAVALGWLVLVNVVLGVTWVCHRGGAAGSPVPPCA